MTTTPNLPLRTRVIYTFGLLAIGGVTTVVMAFLFGPIVGLYGTFGEAFFAVLPYPIALMTYGLLFTLWKRRRKSDAHG